MTRFCPPGRRFEMAPSRSVLVQPGHLAALPAPVITGANVGPAMEIAVFFLCHLRTVVASEDARLSESLCTETVVQTHVMNDKQVHVMNDVARHGRLEFR